MHSKWLIVSLLSIIVLGTIWSLFKPGFYRAHDYVHAARIVEMSRSLQAAHIPPRWSENFGYGYGMPLFNFYAPLPYLIGGIFFLFGFSAIASIKLLILLTSIGTAWGGYRLGRLLFGRAGGVIVAATATLAPYRALNLFVRGALSEAWGMLWIPWIMYAGLRVTQKKGGFILLVLSVTGILLSHNLVALMALPFTFLWTVGMLVVMGYQQQKKIADVSQRVGSLLAGYVLGAGCASWYLLPALLEKQHTKLDATILTGYFDFRLHFLYIRQLFSPLWGYGGSQWGPDDGLSFFLGWGQLMGLALGVLSAFYFLKKGVSRQPSMRYSALFFSFFCLVATLALSLSHAAPIWEYVSFFKYFQFPWRWLSVATVFVALVAGASTTFIKNKLARGFVMGVILIFTFFNMAYFRPESYLDNAEALYYTDSTRIRTEMSGVLPDYIPSGLNTAELVPNPPLISQTDSLRKVEIIVDRPQEKLLNLSLEYQDTITFNIAYFPGWRIEIDGVPAVLEPSDQGLINARLPEGDHIVGVFFAESRVRRLANIMSVVSLLTLLYYASAQQWPSQKKKL